MTCRLSGVTRVSVLATLCVCSSIDCVFAEPVERSFVPAAKEMKTQWPLMGERIKNNRTLVSYKKGADAVCQNGKPWTNLCSSEISQMKKENHCVISLSKGNLSKRKPENIETKKLKSYHG